MNVTLILNIQSRCSLHWNLLYSSFCPACHCLLDASLTSIILLLIVYHCTTFLCYNLITRPLICLNWFLGFDEFWNPFGLFFPSELHVSFTAWPVCIGKVKPKYVESLRTFGEIYNYGIVVSVIVLVWHTVCTWKIPNTYSIPSMVEWWT